MQISFMASAEYSTYGKEFSSGDDLMVVSKADLRWYYFLGSLQISHAGVDISPPWDWVPLFDAMYCMRDVIIFAQGGDRLGRIDFTENAESIKFELNEDFLCVKPSYLKSEFTCTVSEFIIAGSGFIYAELERITSEYPRLAQNACVRSLAREVSIHLS